MAYALVGSLGAVVQTASGSAVSGLAYGQTPTAKNLLTCWWCGQGIATTPSTPSGWTQLTGKSGESLTQGKMFLKVAAGSDAVPTFASITSSVQTVMLGEFSGNPTSAPADQNGGSATGLTSPQTATLAGADAQAGELICYLGSMFYSSAATITASFALNHGATANDTNNNSTNTVNHYVFGYGITTSNSGADTAALTYTTTNATGVAVSANSFKLGVLPELFSVSDPQITRIPGIH